MAGGKHLIGTNARGLRIGESHHNCKYSDETINQVRDMREIQGMTLKQISEATGISRHTVRRICSYQRRAQLYERWKAVRLGSEKQEETGE